MGIQSAFRSAARRLPIHLLTPVLVAATACSGGGPLTSTGPDADSDASSITAITLSVTEVDLDIGTAMVVVATAENADGQPVPDVPLTWISSDTSIVTVSAAGELLGRAVGEASLDVSAHARRVRIPIRIWRPVSSISVTPASTNLAVGATQQLTATVKDVTGQTMSRRRVIWVSQQPLTVAVSASGMVTGQSLGTASVEARVGHKSGTAVVNVAGANGPTPSVTPSSATIDIGETVQLTAALRDADGNAVSGVAFTWATANPAAVTVTPSSGNPNLATVRGLAGGNATVTATANGMTAAAAIIVNPSPVASVTVGPATASLSIGQTTTLTGTVRDAAGNVLTDRVLTWTSSAAAVATVSAAGAVNAVATGSATITAATEGHTGSATVTVTAPAPVPVASISVSPASLNLAIGQTATLTATPRDAAGNALQGRTVTWNAGSTAIATVNGSGSVTAVAAGSTSITASSEGKTGSATATVAAPPPPPAPGTRLGYYVAVNGSSSNGGTSGAPWSLSHALGGAGGRIAPGDTVWVRGGTYNGCYTSSIVGSQSSPVIVRAYPGERATLTVSGCNNPALTVNGSDTWFWGLEFTRTSGSATLGLNVYGPRTKLINCYVHDAWNTGIGLWQPAAGAEVTGCIVWNNGSVNNLDHGIYTQNAGAAKVIRDNVVFNNFAFGIHVYGSDAARLENYRIAGNTVFGSGGTNNTTAPNILVGGGTPASGIVVDSNVAYLAARNSGNIWLGFEVANQDLVARYNLAIGGFHAVRLWRWSTVRFERNKLVGEDWMIDAQGSIPGPTWDANTWHRDPSSTIGWAPGGNWSGFRSATGRGASDVATSSAPSLEVRVRPNPYEAGRGIVTIYNPASLGSVSVDLSSIAQFGQPYTIRHVFNPWGTPLVSGIYSGGTVSVPMTAVTPPQPLSGSRPAPVGPRFGAFLVQRG